MFAGGQVGPARSYELAETFVRSYFCATTIVFTVAVSPSTTSTTTM
jgi:hypothetical protein